MCKPAYSGVKKTKQVITQVEQTEVKPSEWSQQSWITA